MSSKADDKVSVWYYSANRDPNPEIGSAPAVPTSARREPGAAFVRGIKRRQVG